MSEAVQEVKEVASGEQSNTAVATDNPVANQQETAGTVEGEQPKSDAEQQQKDEDKARRNREGYERRLQRERAELKAERDALKRQIEELSKPSQSASVPTRDQYDSDESYIDAIADHKATQKVEEKFRQMDERTTRQNIGREIETTVSKAREKFGEEFDERFDAVKDVQIPIPALVAITRYKDIAPDLVMEIAKNPEIVDLPEPEMIGEIVAMRSRLRANATPATTHKKTTSAPAPIRPPAVSGGAARKSLADLDGDDFKRARGYIK
jgi:hypothetical protein